MEIVELRPDLEKAYDEYLFQYSETLMYTSNSYRYLLKEFTNAEDCYLVAMDINATIKGVLPAFLVEGKYGNVINSLPFYGSNGGVIEFENNSIVRVSLLNSFFELAQKYQCISATIVTSPFEYNLGEYDQIGFDFVDSRIGQITILPSSSKDSIEIDLMNLYHVKTRNMVRKAIKQGIEAGEGYTNGIWDFLYDTHVENMIKIGGVPKPKSFFDAIPNVFNYGKDFKVFTAYISGEPIAAVLILYFNKTIEYFVPVIKSEYRSLQPMSLLIYKAMLDGCQSGYKYWNWGGTWLTQDGVYHFKKRWGTSDMKYRYFTQVFDKSILKVSKNELLKSYPYFYVAPFWGLEI